MWKTPYIETDLFSYLVIKGPARLQSFGERTLSIRLTEMKIEVGADQLMLPTYSKDLLVIRFKGLNLFEVVRF
ncbi:hypothetical protein CQS04_01345 [Chryseomicrobium excrementi]|uniref:Uncharacterized protein n=1 Tax=Chryseomicrobium excrementi TaxID=2041346 RepID=A0A2M9F264_9BACL|nr:hypothetical protein [Chryseomicrobium excrementi]PJK17551.1 hypothetical protein CQS04_01345 [Chryseomicrobium excrementi]